MKCLATFHTTNMAIMFERTMHKQDFINVKIVPVPRNLSASCGLACEFPCEKLNEIKQICSSSKIELDEIHEL